MRRKILSRSPTVGRIGARATGSNSRNTDPQRSESMKSNLTERRLIGTLIILVVLLGVSLKATSARTTSFSGEDYAAAPEPPLSPRLIALQKDLTTGHRAALETFWQEVAKQGTPLVEPTPDKNNYLYVTFLWRGQEETRNVVVITLDQTQLANAGFFAQARMACLPDTDVWHKTYRL